MGLRTRLLLAAAYLLTVVVIALEVPLAIQISERQNREFESGTVGHAAILASRINDDVPLASEDSVRGRDALRAITSIVRDTARETGTRIIVTDSRGRVLADSTGEAALGALYGTPKRPEFGRVLAIRGGTIDISRRFSRTLGEELLLVTVAVVHNREGIGAVRLSESTSTVTSRVRRSWLGLGLVGLAVIVVGLLLAWFLATSLAKPVRKLEEAAGKLGRGDLDVRTAPEGPKEVATLAGAFNRMAGALSSNVQAQRDFVANASHQLRTPLTGIKLRLEAIQEEGGFAAEQAKRAEGELDRLESLVRDLLALARASSVQATGSRVDLQGIVQAATDRWSQPAAERDHPVRQEIRRECSIWADPDDLGHVLDNLIENAIRYTPPGTEIKVGCDDGEGGPSLIVTDSGPGIPDEDRQRIFERFYRGSNGRRLGPGTGLGLAIVAELVGRWGGEVYLADGPEGGGTCVEATFPSAPTVS